MCDMLNGSVERIVRSNWLLGLLDRLRVLRLVLKQRQRSYDVVTQVRTYVRLWWGGGGAFNGVCPELWGRRGGGCLVLTWLLETCFFTHTHTRTH